MYLNKGKLYELIPNGTFTLFLVEYDHQQDREECIFWNLQEPVNKIKVSKGHANIV
jgi:hypothetical protein